MSFWGVWVPFVLLSDIKPECLTEEASSKYREALQRIEEEKSSPSKTAGGK